MQEFENFFVFKITPLEAILQLLASLICGLAIALFYRLNYRGVSYSPNYVISIIMLCMITALVIMVIGNNLARAFGLVGAMSIIRFRTAVKDTMDIMYIFFALAAGLACGAGMHVVALAGTLFIGTAITLISMVINENPVKKEYLLQIIADDHFPAQEILQPLLKRHCTSTKLINLKSLQMEQKNITEMSYYVKFRRSQHSLVLVKEIKELEGVYKVNLFYDEV
jgi:uncharacterized membrane protein YhiD involved in acid resistance